MIRALQQRLVCPVLRQGMIPNMLWHFDCIAMLRLPIRIRSPSTVYGKHHLGEQDKSNVAENRIPHVADPLCNDFASWWMQRSNACRLIVYFGALGWLHSEERLLLGLSLSYMPGAHRVQRNLNPNIDDNGCTYTSSDFTFQNTMVLKSYIICLTL